MCVCVCVCVCVSVLDIGLTFSGLLVSMKGQRMVYLHQKQNKYLSEKKLQGYNRCRSTQFTF